MGKTPEVTASNVQAAGAAAKDSLAVYKKKMFYRRLKVIVIGTTALTLLLAGCLLGFVLPASIHPTGSVRANASSNSDFSSSARLVGLSNNRSFPDSNQTTTNVPATELPVQSSSTKVLNNSQAVSSSSSASTSKRTTRFAEISTSKMTQPTITTPTAKTTTMKPTTAPPSAKTTKWWLVKIHDQISELKRKHALQRTTTTMPTTSTTTKSWETSTPSLNLAHKVWLNRWNQHVVENALQKNKLSHNNNTVYGGDSMRTPAAMMESDDKADIQFETTSSAWDDVKNQLTGNLPRPVNQANRTNVRQVTSYPQTNITTTVPSVITRKV